MRKFCATLLPMMLALLLTGISGQPPQQSTNRKLVEAALREGREVVLVVAPARHRNTDEDEAYGDWASYLKGFTDHAAPKVKIVKVTPAAFSQMLTKPRLHDTYAVLFLRDRDHALVYSGMALEPGVYSAGVAYMTNKRDTKMEADYGLKEEATQFR